MKAILFASASVLSLAVFDPAGSAQAYTLDFGLSGETDTVQSDSFDIAKRGRGRGRGGDDNRNRDRDDDDRGGDDDDDDDNDGSGSGRDKPRIPGGSGCDDPGDVLEHPECRV